MKPTREQQIEFWEGCGWTHTIRKPWYSPEYWNSPLGEVIDQVPSIDLNNLFKYAVPKLANYQMCKGLEPGRPVFGKHFAQVWSLTTGYGEAYSEDPALALFWAICDVFKEG